MSDEGMMTEDVEECLGVVVNSLSKCDLPAKDVVAWCEKMNRADRVQFICREALQALRNHVESRR